MNNKAIKRRRTGLFALMLGLIMVLTAALAVLPVGGSAKANTPDYGVSPTEIDVSTKEDTGYKITLSTAERSCFIYKKNATKMEDFGGDYWVRSNISLAVIFRFDNCKIQERPVLVIGQCSISRPASWSASEEFIFNGDTEIRLGLGYYNLMKQQEANLSAVTITFYGNGTGYKMLNKSKNYSFSFKAVVDTYEKKDGEDDPNSPNFNPEGGSGTDGSATNKKNTIDLWAWFCSIWGSTKPLDIFWQVVFVLLGLVVVGGVVKIFRWLFGSKR